MIGSIGSRIERKRVSRTTPTMRDRDRRRIPRRRCPMRDRSCRPPRRDLRSRAAAPRSSLMTTLTPRATIARSRSGVDAERRVDRRRPARLSVEQSRPATSSMPIVSKKFVVDRIIADVDRLGRGPARWTPVLLLFWVATPMPVRPTDDDAGHPLDLVARSLSTAVDRAGAGRDPRPGSGRRGDSRDRRCGHRRSGRRRPRCR